ncbi:unnamed protein product [Brassica oleracea]|uniref:(rape) hypothetical protein n=1 Tax=Brassica napus TaxID=3708 RepID=A0A816J1N5_BRANA|nr:unnamed protein product [Brassica napus]
MEEILTLEHVEIGFSYHLNIKWKMKLLFGFLHFAERDSPLDGSISSFSVLFSSFILPSSGAPRLSASVVNVAL